MLVVQVAKIVSEYKVVPIRVDALIQEEVRVFARMCVRAYMLLAPLFLRSMAFILY